MNLIMGLKNLQWIPLMVLISAVCGQGGPENKSSLVNTAHLDHLYEEVVIAGMPMAIIHIYADYPDYKWVDVPEEGAACIDDVTRAAVFYLYHFETTAEDRSLEKARRLLDFVLFMQAKNGFFYNFIYSDLTINKTHENSRPVANWWTWRALWSMTEALPFFIDSDPAYYQKLQKAIWQVLPAIDSLLSSYPRRTKMNGFEFPTWLPAGQAADQASVLLLALIAYQEHDPTSENLARIKKIALGLELMQVTDNSVQPSGMFFSWKNIWHDWGNCQAVALLKAAKFSENKTFLESANDGSGSFPSLSDKKRFFQSIRNTVRGRKI